MGSLFVHVAHAPAAGTQAQRGFLVGSAAVDAGHTVSMFLAGGAVELLLPDELEADAFGVPLRDHVENLLGKGGRILLSEGAMRSRGILLDDYAIGPLELAEPGRIVELAFEHDRTLVYG